MADTQPNQLDSWLADDTYRAVLTSTKGARIDVTAELRTALAERDALKVSLASMIAQMECDIAAVTAAREALSALRAERDALRQELEALRAQEPRAWMTEERPYASHDEIPARLLPPLGNVWPLFARPVQASAGPAETQPQDGPDWRELARRLYVELFYCNRQMTTERKKWKQGPSVRDALADAKSALDEHPAGSSPQPAPAREGRQPLTDKQIAEIHLNAPEFGPSQGDREAVAFARAIEAAHGIGSAKGDEQ